jgi:hypothetical protein
MERKVQSQKFGLRIYRPQLIVMPKPPITDSPWLWFSLFTAVGLAALVATGGKFGDRQAGIERRDQARTAVAEGLDVSVDGAGKKSATGVPKYSAPGETQIRLVPLAVTLGLVLAASLGMLVRERMMNHEDTKATKTD